MPKAGAYFLYMVDFKKEKEQEMGRSLSMVSTFWQIQLEILRITKKLQDCIVLRNV